VFYFYIEIVFYFGKFIAQKVICSSKNYPKFFRANIRILFHIFQFFREINSIYPAKIVKFLSFLTKNLLIFENKIDQAFLIIFFLRNYLVFILNNFLPSQFFLYPKCLRTYLSLQLHSNKTPILNNFSSLSILPHTIYKRLIHKQYISNTCLIFRD